MKFACYVNDNKEVKISASDFSKKYRGDNIPPVIKCVLCHQPVYISGTVTPNPNYAIRFNHFPEQGNLSRDICILSSKSKKFIGFKKSNDLQKAKQLKVEFYKFDNLKIAYLVCRCFLGGNGKLKQEDFIKSVDIADNLDIWSYVDVELWSIPFLLMLMSKYPTQKGKLFSFSFDNKKNNLIAYWDDSGKQIMGEKSSFYKKISYNKSTVDELVKNLDLSFWKESNLKIIYNYACEFNKSS